MNRSALTAPAASVPAIAVTGLAKRFAERVILENANFHVATGEAVALIGPNGAGKSTLLRMLIRLLEPDSGELRVLGQDIRQARATALRELRKRVGFVFQQHNLVGRVSVLTNVIHGALGRVSWLRSAKQCLAPTELRQEAIACLERVGLPHLAMQRADGLSGGQSQRVAIARALMQRPTLLLADEPAASLDPAAGDEVMRVFRDLVERDRLTLVFTSHNLAHARGYADRVIGLRGGRIGIDCSAAAFDDYTADALYAA